MADESRMREISCSMILMLQKLSQQLSPNSLFLPEKNSKSKTIPEN